jgi:hypothetical protein
MPSWDSEKLRGFIRAERALVSAQVSGWRNEAPWAAWNGIRQGEHTGYGQLLVDEDFKGVEKLAEQLYG